MPLELPAAIPEIPVSNLEGAVRYYTEALGFDFDFGGGEGGLAGLSRGASRLFLTDWAAREAQAEQGINIIWLNLTSRDEIDQLFAEWSGRGARILSAPEAKPWNLYEFTAADPDGNQIRVFYDFAWESEPTPSAASAETASAVEASSS